MIIGTKFQAWWGQDVARIIHENIEVKNDGKESRGLMVEGRWTMVLALWLKADRDCCVPEDLGDVVAHSLVASMLFGFSVLWK